MPPNRGQATARGGGGATGALPAWGWRSTTPQEVAGIAVALPARVRERRQYREGLVALPLAVEAGPIIRDSAIDAAAIAVRPTSTIVRAAAEAKPRHVAFNAGKGGVAVPWVCGATKIIAAAAVAVVGALIQTEGRGLGSHRRGLPHANAVTWCHR